MESSYGLKKQLRGQLWAKLGRKGFKKQSELEPDFEGQEVGCMLLLGFMTGQGGNQRGMSRARGGQRGDTSQGLAVRGQRALWANDHFSQWSGNA